MHSERILQQIIRILLLATAFIPLVVTDGVYLFPFVFGKMLVFRTIVEIALILFCGRALIRIFSRQQINEAQENVQHSRFLNPLVYALAFFILSAVISSIFAPNAYRAFFGDAQRGEGLLGILHYAAFFVLAVSVFSKRSWVAFSKLSLATGIITAFYAWVQFLGVTKFPFALAVESQPGSFLGNPSFLTSHLVVLFAFAALVYFTAPPKSGWRITAIASSIFFFVTLFIIAVRGSLVGFAVGALIVGIYLAVRKLSHRAPKVHKRARIIGVALIVLVIFFGGIFITTRTAPFWRSVPGLARLTTVSFDNPSVVTRLIAASVSWEAFKERPLFGWGLENYNVAYNKYYDPSYALYAEDWFDRAHNRVADVLVMQGAFGIFAFFALMFLLLRSYLKPSREPTITEKESREQYNHESFLTEGFYKSAPYIGAALIAQFVQNLFLFDQITTYILFFALIGISVSFRNVSATQGRFSRTIRNCTTRPLVVALSGACIIISGYAIYVWNYLPLAQAINVRDAIASRVGQKIYDAIPIFTTPYTFLQAEIRAKFVDLMYESGLVTDEKFSPLALAALDKLEEVTDREPFEPRNLTRLIESYSERAKQATSTEVYAKIEGFARRAVALSPKRQGLLFHLAFSLSGAEQYEESIILAREALALDDRIAKSHYDVAVALALAADSTKYTNTPIQQQYRMEALNKLNRARELAITKLGTTEPYTGTDLSSTQYYLFLESDLKNMVVLYRSLGDTEGMAHILDILIYFHPENTDYYYDAIIVYRALRDAENVIRYAQALKEREPLVTDDMNIVIDLAEKGSWEILDTL